MKVQGYRFFEWANNRKHIHKGIFTNEITSKGVFSLHIFFEETIRSNLKKKTENKNRTLSPGTA